MDGVLPSILISAVSLGVGYFISWCQNRDLIRTATKLLRPFEAISLRDEFYMTHILASQIRGASFSPDIILAITPGGSMIGEWLSRRFLGDWKRPVPMCSIWIHIERNPEGQHLSPPKACAFVSPLSSEPKKILIVNDISRNGRTLEAALESAKKTFQSSAIKTAVLFLSQDAGPPYPDFFVDKPPRRVVFEWKQAETLD